MNYRDFLNQIIDEGVDAAKRDYASQPAKRRGAVAGFEACRGKTTAELEQLLKDAQCARQDARSQTQDDPDALDDFWEARCYEAEVEWVCNCLSAALVNEGRDPIVTPTARGTMKAAAILGAGARG